MELQLNGSKVTVRPLNYAQLRKFRSRLEEHEKSRQNRTADSLNYPSFFSLADLVVDMISVSTGADPEEVAEALPAEEIADWSLYMQYGQDAVEKKRARTTAITTSSSLTSAPSPAGAGSTSSN